ncbi:hypothetical protein [Luteimonas chenhongjianii]|uniref:hypothetical protein n=1 Tax=Luteimonas chenhongjianii TaxID=2006110 RepID=UPI0012FD563B|nr:hypothetical protein [Luteimonas chenhongjianii]
MLLVVPVAGAGLNQLQANLEAAALMHVITAQVIDDSAIMECKPVTSQAGTWTFVI